ncbi:MAG: dihydroneopterin aldolase, partial [Chitinophagaceae bacterium]|nr:dihydroneopterin aldolase [Chitinophagaceae bacterium]
MPGTITVSLHKLIFRAYHGLYPEERKTGNDFEVNL